MALHVEAVRSKRPITLTAFFKRLATDIDALERFAAGGKERESVIRESALSQAHKSLLTKGCAGEVFKELCGPSLVITKGSANSFVIGIPLFGAQDATCGHAVCRDLLSKMRE
jgi:hypothetical protein